eukprot:gene39879-biopygen26718
MNKAIRLTTIAIAASLMALPAYAANMSSSSMMPGDAMAPDAMASDAMAPMAPDAMAGGDMMMTTAKAGEVVAIMPNGQMGSAMMEGDKVAMTIGMSKALAGCVMFITGADGKTYQVDTSSAAAMAECEAVAK